MTANNDSILTKVKHHKKSYDAISPSRPELSQTGKVILITGGAEGIGYAIARGFGLAGAAKVIITGRRKSALDEAVASLSRTSQTTFVARVQDASDITGIENLWKTLDDEGVVVDVLVLNVARSSPPGRILDIGYKEVIADLGTNVGGVAAAAHFFYHQKRRDPTRKLSLIGISTMAIHDFDAASFLPNYSASKSAGAILVQQIAKGVPVDDMQVINFHPGAILTSVAKKAGYTTESLPWDDADLPGHYAVWAASDEARFLHGRFTWAAWDVNEISSGSIRERITTEPNYLKVGVVGI
ncbi:hypothetical protein MY3296_004032 [Beauveria thailandica]